MTTVISSPQKQSLSTVQWAVLALVAAVASIIAVLAVMALALSIWPDAALFRPLESYPRAAVFTLVPAIIATALFAWLAGRRSDPAGAFIRIAIVVLLLSFIPDYILPVPHRTILNSSIAAFLHVIAAIVITTVLVSGYRRLSKP